MVRSAVPAMSGRERAQSGPETLWGHTQHPRGAGRPRSEVRRERQREGCGKDRLEITGDLERERQVRDDL